MRGLSGTVLSAAAGAALPSAFLERHSCPMTLIPPDVAHPCWRVMQPLLAPSARSFAALGADGVRDLVAVNDGLCPRGGGFQRLVTIPDGVTTARLVLEDVALQDGLSSTAPLTVELRDALGVAVVVSATYTPTATSTEVVTSAVALTAGATYVVRLLCNETGQSQFVCGHFRLEPVEATSQWRNFVRVDVTHETLLDCVEDTYRDSRYPEQNQFSHVDIMTDAPTIVVEVYDNGNDALNGRGKFGVLVDGAPMPAVETQWARMNFESVEIPRGGRRIKHVSIVAGPQIITEAPAPRLVKRGTFLAAIYVPRSAYLDIVQDTPQAAKRTVVVVADSKGSGFYSSNPGIDSIIPMLRRAGVRAISYGAGGDALEWEIGTTITVDTCTALARKLCRPRPDEIILQIGRNDFANGLLTGEETTDAIAALADAIHAVDPRVLVTIMTWTREVVETAKGGVEWDDQRDDITTIADTRSTWCRVLPSAELWTSTDVETYTSTDDVHLSDKGQGKVVQHIVGIDHPFSILQMSNLFAWHEFGDGLPGGAPGSVTATGSSPPTVTLSGTATVAGRLRIEIERNYGGVRGVARFRWGLWSPRGIRWIQHEVLTAASVLLPGLGITVNFSTGSSYPNNAVYTADLQIASCPDLSGNGRHATALANQYAMYAPIAIGGKPAALFDPTSPADCYRITDINVPAPYTICAVAQMGSAATRAIVGRSATGSGMLMFSNSEGTALTVNDGGPQVTATATMSDPNCFIVRVNGASSSIRVNGTQTDVSLSDNPLLGYFIGRDGVSSSFSWEKWIRRVVVCSSAISDGECRAFEALCRAEGFIP